jgi:adenylate cyclase
MTNNSFKRKLTAIFHADVMGFSRLMGEDEIATLRTLYIYREIMATLIQQKRGRVVGTEGDSILAEFVSVVGAVQCAVEIQEELKSRNAELPENRKMEFRIGINLGDVIEEGGDIFGDGVNIAARIEALANPGGICISRSVYSQIKKKLILEYEDLGEHTFKNIAEPIQIYRVLLEQDEPAPKVTPEKVVKPGQRRWIALAGVIILIVTGMVIWKYYLHPTPSIVEVASEENMAFPLPDKPSIAILPFVNLSNDSRQRYFSDGVTENVIIALSKVRNIFVIARNSMFTYKDEPVKVKQVSEELGVRYVLKGSVKKTKGRVRITTRLIDAITGKHLWTERYSRKLKDLFALQDEIIDKIIVTLQVKLTKEERAYIDAKSTNNLDAYLKYMQASKHGQRHSKEGNSLARKFAQEAIALDPEYAEPYLVLSATHLKDIQLDSTNSPKESLKKAEELAQKAISLSGAFARAHAYLGRIYISKGQYDKAIAEGERALAIAPNSAFVHAAIAVSLEHAGRPEEAIALFEKAIRLSPIL